jgi:hypothetical protein
MAGFYGVSGLRANSDLSLPQWTISASADAVWFLDPSTGLTISKFNVASAESFGQRVAGGDYSDAYAFFLYGEGKPIIGTIENAAANAGPNLSFYPGYTAFAPLFPIRIQPSGQLPLGLRVRGKTCEFTQFVDVVLYDGSPSGAASPQSMPYWHLVPDSAETVNIWHDAEISTNGTSGLHNISYDVLGSAPLQAWIGPNQTFAFNAIMDTVCVPGMALNWQVYDSSGYAPYESVYVGMQVRNYRFP